jgi:hypothetical protein
VVGVEADRDRYTYHFDNPSTFDTTAPVSHFFEQRYDADNIWLTASARYVAGVRWETSGGVTPQRSSTANDYDTFFDPNNTVIVSGTTGPNTIHSFRLSQRAELGKAGPVTFSAGYRLRIDLSNFGVGHKTVTTNGALVSASDVTTREMTSSQMHELFAGAAWTAALAPGWTLLVAGEAAPTTIARLAVQLPDKYPGQDLVFVATVAAANGRIALEKRVNNWIVEMSAGAGTTWSYRTTASLSRNTAAARMSVGRAF